MCHAPLVVAMGESTRLPLTTRSRGEADVDHQRRLADSPFPGDTGEASENTRRLIATAVAEVTPTAYLRAVAALCGDRLLVPVVATTTRLGESVGGLTSDKEAEMSLVILQVRDGRRALLAFTGLDALQAWQPDARPVPVTIDIAAQAARSEELTVVLIDVAGPHPFVIEGEVLADLAAGHRLVELPDGQFGWMLPAGD
jgi:type III secretion system (T3SS) SseB-like protein